MTSKYWKDRKTQHNPHYFGKISDTILIERNLWYLPPPPPPPSAKNTNWTYKEPEKNKFEKYFIYSYRKSNIKSIDSVNLSIKIDTNQIINNYNKKAFPVLIENKSIDTTYIGYGGQIPIITEAKTKDGIWKPIENKYSYKCAMGIPSIILPPKELVITSQFVYFGSFKTKLRIKLGNNYSTEFYGRINESQFENEWENGKRKTLPNNVYN